MKFYFWLLILIGAWPQIGQAQEQRICKDQAVPRGHRVVGETMAPECGQKAAWIVRKIGAPAPITKARPAPAELGEGSPDSEKKSIRMLFAASKTAANVPFVITGTIAVSSDYFGPYGEAAATHHAFEIRDSTGAAYVYALKEESNTLRQKLLARKKMRGSFSIVMPTEILAGGKIYADLIGYQLQPPTTGDEEALRNTSRVKN